RGASPVIAVTWWTPSSFTRAAYRSADARRAPRRVEDAAHLPDPSRLTAARADHHQPRRVSLPAQVEAAREGDARAVRRPARFLVVGLAARQSSESGPVCADHVELAARRARVERAARVVRVVERDEGEPRAVGRPGRRDAVQRDRAELPQARAVG